MALILAVLEKRAGFYFSNLDAYLNVVGGLRIDEPAVDLAVAMALVSSLKDTPIRDDTVVFGEIGLAGELRSVSHIEARVSEHSGSASRAAFCRTTASKTWTGSASRAWNCSASAMFGRRLKHVYE
jgi:predicted ATP-dependent serine protease